MSKSAKGCLTILLLFVLLAAFLLFGAAIVGGIAYFAVKNTPEEEYNDIRLENVIDVTVVAGTGTLVTQVISKTHLKITSVESRGERPIINLYKDVPIGKIGWVLLSERERAPDGTIITGRIDVHIITSSINEQKTVPKFNPGSTQVSLA